ncbi:MAG: DUF3427 domain-containing protein [Christensenellales bacterium]|jgi:5-methylcytosine-specific restriction protein A
MFKTGNLYSRKDIYRLLDVPLCQQGGNWATGYTSYNGEYYIFANINEPGRTGHNYQNHWENGFLHWKGKISSHIGQPTIKNFINGTNNIHIFTRDDNADVNFVYRGLGKVASFQDTVPVSIVWKIVPQ